MRPIGSPYAPPGALCGHHPAHTATTRTSADSHPLPVHLRELIASDSVGVQRACDAWWAARKAVKGARWRRRAARAREGAAHGRAGARCGAPPALSAPQQQPCSFNLNCNNLHLRARHTDAVSARARELADGEPRGGQGSAVRGRHAPGRCGRRPRGCRRRFHEWARTHLEDEFGPEPRATKSAETARARESDACAGVRDRLLASREAPGYVDAHERSSNRKARVDCVLTATGCRDEKRAGSAPGMSQERADEAELQRGGPLIPA